ncbi:hypothetical protein DFH29DRAFT_1020180 [Suillus ampliporus]|nr:hypothetical protein DFH29DRAFT_1020180 [Suillus ampliporus]
MSRGMSSSGAILIILTHAVHGTGAAHAARSFQDATSNIPSVSNSYARGEAFGNPRRKQTIINLLDVLSELSNESSTGSGQLLMLMPIFLPYPWTRNSKTQDQNHSANSRGKKRIPKSCATLLMLFTTGLAVPLEPCPPLFYYENAATLFPREVSRQPRETLFNPNFMDLRRTWRGHQPPLQQMTNDNLEPESFPSQFASLAKDVVTFLNYLNEFTEFTDEAVNTSMRAFEVDLKYWASCLQEYKGSVHLSSDGQSCQLGSRQFRYPAVQRYIHDLTSEIGDHIDRIMVNLSMFIEIVRRDAISPGGLVLDIVTSGILPRMSL